jgi:two-component system, OmpR family, phosphate regulon response regulator OmpR
MSAPFIVVIDDDPIILDLMCEVLRDAGYRALPCSSADDAKALLVRDRPALVILDIRMGGPDEGVGLLCALRECAETAALPVIVCSADLAFLREQESDLRARGCDILAKPFDLDDLLARVSTAAGPPVQPIADSN